MYKFFSFLFTVNDDVLSINGFFEAVRMTKSKSFCYSMPKSFSTKGKRISFVQPCTCTTYTHTCRVLRSAWPCVNGHERFMWSRTEVLWSICSNTRQMKRTVNVYFAVTELRSKILYWLKKGSNFALVRSLIAIERTYEQNIASPQFLRFSATN